MKWRGLFSVLAERNLQFQGFIFRGIPIRISKRTGAAVYHTVSVLDADILRFARA